MFAEGRRRQMPGNDAVTEGERHSADNAGCEGISPHNGHMI